jgi:parallel beta-helix repeat protein
MRRTAIALTLIILMVVATGAQFAEISSANFFPDPGPDLPRIYIRSDGSVDPLTAPIERKGNYYTLTDDVVLYTIEIQHDNIVLDGAGHTIRGNGTWLGYENGNNGVIIAEQNNINITRLNVEQCYTGIRISSSSSINVADNTFSKGTTMGVAIQDSTNIIIEENNFTDLITDLNTPAIRLNGSKNVVKNNKLTGSTYGMKIEGSSNIISDNKIESLLPIIVDKADSNTIARNNITGPVSSSHFPDQNHKGNEGITLFSQCSNNMIFGNNITGFINQAVRTVFSCSKNTFYGNYMADNGFAVVLQEGALNNKFYGNTFAADSCNVSVYDAESNFWDNSTLGNFWGDYNGVDSNGDGIGDSPYLLKGFKWDTNVDGFVTAPAGQDNYPLMNPYDIERNAAVLPTAIPFATLLAAAAFITMVLGVGLIFYFKRRNHQAENDLVEKT